MTLLSPGILNTVKKWLPRARLWKLLLSQNVAGFWRVPCAPLCHFCAHAFACRDVSSTTALVLEARAPHEVDAIPKSLLKRLLDMVRSMAETVADAEAAGDEESAVDGRREQDDLDDFFEFHEEGEENADDDEKPHARKRAKRRPATDCPVTCSADAIVLAIPRSLTKLATDVPTAVKLRRVWTTACCIAVLERLVVCWVWGDGDIYAPEERCVLSHALAIAARVACSLVAAAAPSWTLGASGSRRRRRSGRNWQPPGRTKR